MKSKILVMIFILINSIVSSAQQWNRVAPMPTPRFSIGATVCDGLIYVIGGGSGSGSVLLGTNEVYNPLTNTWATKAAMPSSRSEIGLATVNSKIYAIGGWSGTTPTNLVQEYNPLTNTWTNKAPMPTARSLFSVAVLNNKIYAIGGYSGSNRVEEYDPQSNTWTIKAPLPVSLQSEGSAVGINGKLFYIGGKTSTAIVNTTYSYDPISNTWSNNANLPQNLWCGASVDYNSELHFLGGSSSFTAGIQGYIPNYSTHYIYNSTTNIWSSGLPMINKRSTHSAVTWNDRIYVIGGLDSLANPVNWNDEYKGNTSIPLIGCPGAQMPLNLINGLVGWWPFCGDADDESGNGNDLIPNGSPNLVADRFGSTNSAYNFNGTTDYFSTNLGLLDTITISYWFNHDNTNIGSYDVTFKYAQFYNQFSHYAPWNDNLVLTSNNSLISSSTVPTYNFWHHVVSNFIPNGYSRLYIDGLLVDSSNTIVNPFSSNSGDFVVANDPNGQGSTFPIHYYKGILDDIGIWNRALDSSEVTQLYNTGLCTQTIAGSCDTLIFNANITGFNPVTYANHVTVYPNPAHDNLVIDCGSNYTGLSGYSIRITNTLGQVVYNSPITSQVTNVPLIAPQWVNGTYVVQFINPQGTVMDTKRIIIQ